MASVFDFELMPVFSLDVSFPLSPFSVSIPAWILRPNLAKWSKMIWAAFSVSSRVWKINAPSSKYTRLGMLKGVPADFVLWPLNLPLSFGKNLYSGLLVGKASSSLWMTACITNKNSRGAVLSPC